MRMVQMAQEVEKGRKKEKTETTATLCRPSGERRGAMWGRRAYTEYDEDGTLWNFIYTQLPFIRDTL